MYDKDYLFVDNPLNRSNVSQRNALKANPDGSIDLYIQHESPGRTRNRTGFRRRRTSPS